MPKAALVIGVDPILAYTCQVQVPDETNDWNVAGGLRGAPVELARCTTERPEVPATSEVVIEFEVDLGQHRDGRAARRIHRLLHAGPR